MKQQIRLLFALVMVFLISCGDAPVVDKKEAKSWETYDTESFSIRYPSAWLLDESGHMGTEFILSCPRSDQKDEFTENVNLLVQRVGVAMDLDEFAKLSEAQLLNMVGKDKITINKRSKANGVDFQKMSYSITQASLDLRIDQYYWVTNGSAYVLTFTVEEKMSKEMSKVGTDIMNSFKFKY